MPATPEPTVIDHGGEVEVDIPAGVMYAALAMRLRVGDADAASRVMLGLADRFALVVQEFNDAMDDGEVVIVTGAEAIVAHETAAEMTALHHGLDPHSRVIGVDVPVLADHMRVTAAKRNGVDGVLPWNRLKESEQRQWLSYAESAADYIRGAEALGGVGT